MASSKLRKISKIVKELSIIKGQTNYDISGLTLSLCKFYYREPQKQFKDLPIGDYTIDTSNNAQTLIIRNPIILDKSESIQVCYQLDLVSSKYQSDFEVDINRLASSYNEAIEDLHDLWAYIRSVGMVADDTTMDLILPQLNTDEVWVKTIDGYKGVSLTDAEGTIKNLIDKYSKEKIDYINLETEKYTNTVLKPMLDEYKNDKELQLDLHVTDKIKEITTHTNNKKSELNTHEKLKEQELNDLKNQLAKNLEDIVKGAVADKGIIPNGTDWHTLARGSYYVLDLFNSNFTNHPYQLANQNESKGIVVVTETEQGQSKVITYYSISKREFFTVLVKTGIWSEWSVIGGGKGTVYEITQPNHGFNFNAISLNSNNLWELANPNIGADAVAIKIDNDRFELLLNGQGIIPTSARDDKGQPFVNDEYYFMSTNIVGGLQKEKPTQILFQPLLHTRTVEGKLVADVQIGDIHDLTIQVVDSNTVEKYGLLTKKDLDKIVLRNNGEFYSVLKSKINNNVVGDIGAISNTEIGITNITSKKSIKLKNDGTAEYPSDGLNTKSKELTGAINELLVNINETSPFSNYKGIYDTSLTYNIGDVVKITGHEPCYVFETTLCEMADPQHPKYFRKVYKIQDTMYYIKESDGWEILFLNEEKIPFYTIPQKGNSQVYKSTVDNYFPYSDIRGVVFNGFTGTTIAQILDKNDATKQSNGNPSNLTSLGNVMNEYPKFYCQVKMTPQGRRYRIFSYKNPTKKIALDIKPHPVFKKPDGSYKNFEYLSRYEGSHDGTRVVSLSGKSPYVSITQGTFRDKCRNGRNTNWNMLTFEQISMLQCLYIVEFGDLNSQAVLGQGRANTSSASATGTCNALGMRSGRISDDDANGNICYRGLEDFYANIWDFVDGFMISNSGYHYTNDPSKFGNLSAMTLFPKTLNFKIPDGYVNKMEVIDGYEHLLIPYGTTGSATTYYCDHFWSHDTNEENIAIFGGFWYFGAFCGCFCLSCPNVASDSWAAVGGRLSVFV